MSYQHWDNIQRRVLQRLIAQESSAASPTQQMQAATNASKQNNARQIFAVLLYIG